MTIEDIKNAALDSAQKNGGKLTRLPNGRWKGAGAFQFGTDIIRGLITDKRLTVTARSEASGKHGNNGYPIEVSV